MAAIDFSKYSDEDLLKEIAQPAYGDVWANINEKRRKEELANRTSQRYSDYEKLYNDIQSTYGGLEDKISSDSSLTDINNAISALKDKQSSAETSGQQTVSESNAVINAQKDYVHNAQKQEIAAKNTGLGASRAGNLASNNTYGNVYTNLVQGLNNQNAQTQADYLEKMGYADALQQNASNLSKARDYNVAGAFMQSDENEKVEPNRDGKLPESNAFDAIAQLEEELGEVADYFDDENIINQLAKLETVSYQYKHPEQEGEDNETHKAGFTAQSLKEIPLFKKCVIEDDGVLKIDLDLLEEIITNKVLPALNKAIGE